MSRFRIHDTPISGLQLIERQPIGDERGYLERIFCTHDLKTLMGRRSVTQINHTLTKKKGTVRGLHFQKPPHSEMKLISCLRGEVFDVALDVRKNSPTFLQWHGQILSENNHRTFCIPEGFAHGFQTLTEDCELIYLHTAAYAPEAELGLNALDPRLAISWPIGVMDRSIRDQQHLMLNENLQGFL